MAFFISFSYVVAQCFKNVLENKENSAFIVFINFIYLFVWVQCLNKTNLETTHTHTKQQCNICNVIILLSKVAVQCFQNKCFTNHIYVYEKSFSIKMYSKVASKGECSILTMIIRPNRI